MKGCLTTLPAIMLLGLCLDQDGLEEAGDDGGA